MGNYFVHRSQTMLFGYSGKCRFPLARFRPNLIGMDGIDPKRHSEKPEPHARMTRKPSSRNWFVVQSQSQRCASSPAMPAMGSATISSTLMVG